MMSTILSAAAVLGAEYGVRKAVNAAQETDFPKKLGEKYTLRRAHNFGIVGSRMEQHPKLVLAYQTAATGAAVTGAILVSRTVGAAKPLVRLGAGLAAGGALANFVERLTNGYVTDYIHGPGSAIPLLRHRIWNIADMAIFNGCAIALAGAAL
jgi:signal peptidase II